MTKIKTGIHKDHRQRIKEKASKHGVKIFDDHEVLEMILFNVIPYKDTNPIAHTLINHFGSLANVLDADMDSLMLVPGIGLETARYLTFLPQYFDRYQHSRDSDKLTFKSSNDIVSFFKKRYVVRDKEVLYIFCLNNMAKLKQVLIYDGIDDTRIMVSIKKIYKDIITSGASQIFLIHTHPNGTTRPSKQDINFTREIITSCYSAQIKVNDHMIFTEWEHSSMRDEIFNIYHEKGIDIMIEPGKNKNFRFN